MPVKKTPKKKSVSKAKTTKKTPKKKVAAAPRKKTSSKIKKGDVYECRVCGYRIKVDNICGCVEEHVFICCDKQMKKKKKVKKTK